MFINILILSKNDYVPIFYHANPYKKCITHLMNSASSLTKMELKNNSSFSIPHVFHYFDISRWVMIKCGKLKHKERYKWCIICIIIRYLNNILTYKKTHAWIINEVNTNM